MFKSLNKWFRIRHLESCIYRLSTPEHAEKNAPLINSMRIEIAALDGSAEMIKEVQQITLLHWQNVVEQAKALDAAIGGSVNQAKSLATILSTLDDVTKNMWSPKGNEEDGK